MSRRNAFAAAPDYAPDTRITDPQPVTRDQMLGWLMDVRERHGDTLQKFHEAWYAAPFTWGMTEFLGVGCMKCPMDLWMYQQILTQHRPRTIIETGTFRGGSALWFAFLMDALGIDDGQVLTVDYKDQRDPRAAKHPRIHFYQGDSRKPALAKHLGRKVQYPLLVSLDADHSAAHVEAELDVYAPLCQRGDWLVVEDTNIGWESDPGARGGLEQYVLKHPGEWVSDPLAERFLLTMHPGAWLVRVGDCTHNGSARGR